MSFQLRNDLFPWNSIYGQTKNYSKLWTQMASSLVKGNFLKQMILMSSLKDANQSFMKNKDPTPQQAPTGRGRGRGGPNRAAASNIIQGRQNLRTIEKQDKNIWIHLVHHLRREKLLPVVIFVFSKRRCEENAAVLTNIDLCTASEKSEVHIVVEKSIARLKVEDRGLPQIRRTRDLLGRGVAVHHGGLLPIVKEVD